MYNSFGAMRKTYIAVIIALTIIGSFLSLSVSAIATPQLINIEIGRNFVKLTPAPLHMKQISDNFYKIYKFPDTTVGSASSTNSSSIALLTTYPITIVTPTNYIATSTDESLIIAPRDFFISTPSTASTSTGTETGSQTTTPTESQTSTPHIIVADIKLIPKSERGETFIFLSGEDLYKILMAYTRHHEISTPTETVKSIAYSTAKWSKTFGIDPLLILAQMRWESKFKPYARSKSDAKGLMQLKDFVYQPIANFLGLDTSTNAIYDIDNNIAAGTYYMYYKMRTWGTEAGALGAYLLGDTGYLQALWNETEGKDSIGTTYNKYIAKIMNTRNELRSYIGLPPYNKPLSVYISPGHGTYDNGYYDMGAIVGQYYESRINLAIALKLKNILESKGIKVYMARTEENNPETPYLSERVRMINLLHPNVVISIHANANPYSKSIRGYEIYYRKAYDRFLAKSIDKSMDLISPIPKHKDPQYMKLIILSGWPPSVLIETGYMTNSQDLSILLNDNYQSAIAQSIAEGVLTFLGSDNR